MDLTGLCLGFFWGITFAEICERLKKKYYNKEVIENKELSINYRILKDKIRELNNIDNNLILKED